MQETTGFTKPIAGLAGGLEGSAFRAHDVICSSIRRYS